MRWNLRMKAAERGIWKSHRDAPAAGRGRPGDQRREDVGAVDRHPDHDPARRPGRDLRRAGLHPADLLIPRAGEGRRCAPQAAPATSPGARVVRRLGRERPAPRCEPPSRRSQAARIARVAWTTPRVDFCYDCLPGGPFPAAVPRCGSADYFTQGLCEICHPGGRASRLLPRLPGLGCTREHNWRCWCCSGWRTPTPSRSACPAADSGSATTRMPAVLEPGRPRSSPAPARPAAPTGTGSSCSWPTCTTRPRKGHDTLPAPACRPAGRPRNQPAVQR